jgi:hypothetical protein
MAWTITLRNQLITGADVARNKLAAWYLKNSLVTAGWTVKGSGYGTAGASGGWDGPGTDRWLSLPTLNLCWVGLENVDGVQILLQCSTNDLKLYWLKGAYTGAGAATATLPDRGAIPAAEVADSGVNVLGYPTATGEDYYLQVATDGATSFWAWAQKVSTGLVCYCTAVVRATETKAADLNPYWGYRYGVNGISAFTLASLVDSAAANCFCLHPGAGIKKIYGVADLYTGIYPMDAMPVDPNSGYEQLIDCIVCCGIAGFKHLKGKLPGLMRCSGLRSVGSTFGASTYVSVGRFALPWSPGTAML